MTKQIIFILFCMLFSHSLIKSQEQLLKMKSDYKIDYKTSPQIVQNNNFEKKSAGLAILYSLLLPGMGELYAGDYSTGKYFTIADGIIWGTVAGISVYGNNKENDYRAFAQSFGGVSLKNKDDEYFANIGIYENIDQYNREKELNREFDEVYNSDSHYWSWSGTDQRKQYRGLWSSSESAKNNLRFAVGALVLNRIVSAIFAVRAVSAYNKRQNNQLSWKMNFNVEQTENMQSRIVLNFSHAF